MIEPDVLRGVQQLRMRLQFHDAPIVWK